VYQFDQVLSRRRLGELLEGCSPEKHAELTELVQALTRELLDDEPSPAAAAAVA
jgi:hypothetical protein